MKLKKYSCSDTTIFWTLIRLHIHQVAVQFLEARRLQKRLFICCLNSCQVTGQQTVALCTQSVQRSLLVCRRLSFGKKVNKDTSSLLPRQRRHFASKGASNRSLPHAVQEYFRILIARLVCCCHMAFISIL